MGLARWALWLYVRWVWLRVCLCMSCVCMCVHVSELGVGEGMNEWSDPPHACG